MCCSFDVQIVCRSEYTKKLHVHSICYLGSDIVIGETLYARKVVYYEEDSQVVENENPFTAVLQIKCS